jgi:hypothetical protein
MVDDLRDAAVKFHHLLVVAATLQRRSCFDVVAHENVNLERLPLSPIRFEQTGEFLQKPHVSAVLSIAPEGFVVFLTSHRRNCYCLLLVGSSPRTPVPRNVALLILRVQQRVLLVLSRAAALLIQL